MSTFASQINLKPDLVSSATLTSDFGSGVLALGERDDEVRLRLLPFFIGPKGDKGDPGGLVTARIISLSGDVSGSVAFDGNSDVTLEATVIDDSHEHSILDGGHF